MIHPFMNKILENRWFRLRDCKSASYLLKILYRLDDHYNEKHLIMSPYVEFNKTNYLLHLVYVSDSFNNFLKQDTPLDIKFSIDEEIIEIPVFSFEDFLRFLFEIESFQDVFKEAERDYSFIQEIDINPFKFAEKVNELFFGFEISFSTNQMKINNECVTDNRNNIAKFKEEYSSDRRIAPEIPDSSRVGNEEYALRIFNVGQANCSALVKYDNSGDYNVVTLFDLGCQKAKRGNGELIEVLNKVNSDTTIIISHFDNDHFNNYISLDLTKTNRWIFPEHEPEKYIANKFYQGLLAICSKKTYSGKIYSYSVPYNLSSYLSIEQNTTDYMDPYQSTPINSKSLICILNFEEQNVLIPGDALYEEFPDSICHKKYKHILVPHHGCKYFAKDSRYFPDKINSVIGEDTTGYVMCGKNRYGHANINHLSWYPKFLMFYNSKIYNDDKSINRTISDNNIPYFEIKLGRRKH